MDKAGWYSPEGGYMGSSAEEVMEYLKKEGDLDEVVIQWGVDSYDANYIFMRAWSEGNYLITSEFMYNSVYDHLDGRTGTSVYFGNFGKLEWRGEE